MDPRFLRKEFNVEDLAMQEKDGRYSISAALDQLHALQRRVDGIPEEYHRDIGRSVAGLIEVLSGASEGEASVSDRSAAASPSPRAERRDPGETVLEAVMENTHAHLAYLDPQFNFVRVNSAYAKGSGYRKEQLLGRNHFDLFPHAGNQAIFERVRDTGEPVAFTAKPFDHPKQPERGTTYWDWTLVPVKDPAGRVEGLVFSLLDVTDLQLATEQLKSARDALEQANRRVGDIIGSLVEGYVEFDRQWRVVAINPQCAAHFGLGFEDLIGRDVGEVFPQARDSEFYRQYQRAFRDNIAVHFEAPSAITAKWFEVHAYPSDTGLAVYMHDITERKRAEEEIQKIARFPAENPNPVLRVDSQGTLIYANPAGAALLGAWDIGVGGPLPIAWRDMALRSLKSDSRLEAEWEVGERIFSLAFAPIPEMGYVNVYGSDVTDRKRAEEALRESEQAIRTSRDELEERVLERTAELSMINTELELEVAERRRAETALDAERKRFQDVLDVLPAYVVLLTPDYHVLFANRFFRERFGESQGKRCFVFLSNRTEPCEACESFEVLKTGRPHHWEWTGPDGCIYDIHDFPFVDVDGSTLILEMGIDITERKRAQAELKKHQQHLADLVKERTADLRESEERLRLASSAAQLGVFAWDVSTDSAHWQNERMYEIFGRTREQGSLSRALLRAEAMEPQDRPAFDRAITEAMETDKLFHALFRIRRFNDGQQRWLECSGRFDRAPDGSAQRLAGVVADVTERKQAEEALRLESKQIALANRVLETFVRETGDVVFDKALEAVLEATGSIHGVFGYVDENGDLVCPTMSKLLAECEVPDKCIHYPRTKWKGLWSRSLLEKQVFYSNTAPAVPDGHVPITRNLAVPILFQGQAIGLWNLANKPGDYTEEDCRFMEGVAERVAPVLYAWLQKELREKERRRAEEQTRQSLREKEVLLRELYHRVKNNLQVVSSLLRLQSRTVKKAEAVKALTDSQGRIQSMAFVHEKLYQSRDLANIDLGAYLDSLVQALARANLEARGRISVTTDGGDLALDISTAIPSGLIVNELVSNALEHAFADGRSGEVVVSCRRTSDDWIELVVRDDGVGFPEGMDIRKATSLGLQLVVTLAENQLRGRVDVDRTDGTAFRVRFPMTRPHSGG